MVRGRAGDDKIIPAAGARIPHFVSAQGEDGDDVLVAPRHAESSLLGGPGADMIRSGSASDFFTGGRGDDVITGGGGADEIWAGSGRDVLFGGRGGDFIVSHGRERDQVSCGAGRDRALVDRRDRLRSCELILPWPPARGGTRPFASSLVVRRPGLPSLHAVEAIRSAR